MYDPIAPIVAACEALATELAYADFLVADQHARIEALEAEVARLRAILVNRSVAA